MIAIVTSNSTSVNARECCLMCGLQPIPKTWTLVQAQPLATSELQFTDRPQQRVLRLVEICDGAQVIRSRTCQLLLGLDCFQHDADAEFLSLLREPEAFIRCRD